MSPLHKMWSPSTPKKRYSTPILPLCIHQGFIPPCEEKEESANMTLILAWEYGRNWLQQRDEFLRNKKHIESKKYVQPDIAWWLRQRKRTSFNPREKYLEEKKLNFNKNMNLSSFAESKKRRALQGS